MVQSNTSLCVVPYTNNKSTWILCFPVHNYQHQLVCPAKDTNNKSNMILSRLVVGGHSLQRLPRAARRRRPPHPDAVLCVLQQAFSLTGPGVELDLLRIAGDPVGGARG